MPRKTQLRQPDQVAVPPWPAACQSPRGLDRPGRGPRQSRSVSVRFPCVSRALCLPRQPRSTSWRAGGAPASVWLPLDQPAPEPRACVPIRGSRGPSLSSRLLRCSCLFHRSRWELLVLFGVQKQTSSLFHLRTNFSSSVSCTIFGACCLWARSLVAPTALPAPPKSPWLPLSL